MKFLTWLFLFLIILLFIFLLPRFQSFSNELKPWGLMGFLLLQFLQVLIAPIPGHALGVLGGALFGTFRGGIYTLLAQTGGGLLLYFLARRYGLRFLRRFINEESLRKITTRIRKSKIGIWGWRKSDHSPFNHSTHYKFVIALFIMYLLPGFPDDLLAIVAGFSRVKILPFLFALLLGRAPGIFLLSALGEGALHLPHFLRWLTF